MSPHQIPYIVQLLDDERVDEVVLVAGETVSETRKAMGWNVTEFQGLDRCKVYIRPHYLIIESLMEARQADSYHLFSGIRADAFVFQCLKKSLSYSMKRGVITERPNTYDFKWDIENARPYWMHRIRFFLQDRKYARHIQYVFAMGNEAVNYFRSLGMKWNVFPFCYCTQPLSTTSSIDCQSNESPQYLYCGSLSHRKSPLTIIDAMAKVYISGGVLMIGDGILRASISKMINKMGLKDSIHLLGTIPQTEVPVYMLHSDIFILPSIYDGWGAVVNEALQAGCYVLCSDAAGASDLILKDERLGKVFKSGNASQLSVYMLWCNDNIDEIRKNRDFRKRWAKEHISGKVVAKYMIDCLSGL